MQASSSLVVEASRCHCMLFSLSICIQMQHLGLLTFEKPQKVFMWKQCSHLPRWSGLSTVMEYLTLTLTLTFFLAIKKTSFSYEYNYLSLFFPKPLFFTAHDHVDFIYLALSYFFPLSNRLFSASQFHFLEEQGGMVVICSNQCLTKITTIYYYFF